MSSFLIFIYLQVLDVLTTLATLRFGGGEANPVVRWLMGLTPYPIVGMVAGKVAMVVSVWLILDVAESYNQEKYEGIRIAFNLVGLGVVLWNCIGLAWF